MAEDLHKRICLVEDDPHVARLIGATLRDFGFAHDWRRTGADLLRLLRSGEVPDLCIVDLGLPDMDGMELVRALRSDGRCGVLILTGRGDTIDRVMGLELGADDYMVKPFEPRELIARVRSILRRYQPEPAADAEPPGIAHFVGWRFAPGSNTLSSADGESSTLSTAEAQLLKTMLQHPNRILTREQLMGERNLSSFDRSIDVRISRLRRKLEDDPQNPKLIKTVYGAGYLFACAVVWR